MSKLILPIFDVLKSKKSYQEALNQYQKFAFQNPNSKLAKAASWNQIDLFYKIKNFPKAADAYLSFAKGFPNDKKSKRALIKSAELYELMSQPTKALVSDWDA